MYAPEMLKIEDLTFHAHVLFGGKYKMLNVIYFGENIKLHVLFGGNNKM